MALWGVTLPILGALAFFQLWYPFYFLASGATVYYALFPLRPGRGRQHATGAEVMFISLCASVFMQEILNDKAPLIAHQAIDGFVGTIFLAITWRRRAIWSALCVAIHASMAVLTYRQYTYNLWTDHDYLEILNWHFIAALAVINIAVFAGRQTIGETIDSFILRRVRGWTFTGLRYPRLSLDRAKA